MHTAFTLPIHTAVTVPHTTPHHQTLRAQAHNWMCCAALRRAAPRWAVLARSVRCFLGGERGVAAASAPAPSQRPTHRCEQLTRTQPLAHPRMLELFTAWRRRAGTAKCSGPLQPYPLDACR
mmetsp:Transcript_57385/g.131731  ORF Transcript_57385/g.131731 Transcript_57385/m.131731 type:complete len:122 (-) Transcript_57385:1237-1602(-)